MQARGPTVPLATIFSGGSHGKEKSGSLCKHISSMRVQISHSSVKFTLLLHEWCFETQARPMSIWERVHLLWSRLSTIFQPSVKINFGWVEPTWGSGRAKQVYCNDTNGHVKESPTKKVQPHGTKFPKKGGGALGEPSSFKQWVIVGWNDG